MVKYDELKSDSHDLEIRVVAQQFAWHIHYPGPDGKFGITSFSEMDPAINPVGINYEGHWWGDMDDIVNHIDAFSQGYNDHTGQLIYSESHDEGRIVHEATVY